LIDNAEMLVSAASMAATFPFCLQFREVFSSQFERKVSSFASSFFLKNVSALQLTFVPAEKLFITRVW
jgi:hypothetical protein